MALVWHKDDAEVFIPSNTSEPEALERTTHLAIGAHADDLEIMCWDGILNCFRQPFKWFTGVTVTNGAGSPRSGTYTHFTDEDMVQVRRREQRAAAVTGEYSAMVSLMYTSSQARESAREALIADLCKLLHATKPEVVYTHNLVDKHNTHLAISTAVVEAARRVGVKPKAFLGCEVWRGLDWVPDSLKVVMDVSEHPALTQSLVGLYDSQIAAGKRYDLATVGRKRANATFFEAYEADTVTHLEYAMDMMPLLHDPGLSYRQYVGTYLEQFQNSVYDALGRYS
jgi:LmbE family N-acetylglucosaminyl deacetylase